MLEELDAIAWEQLRHAYGEAGDVPELLRGLVSPDEEERGEALYELFGNIWHQGTVYEATAHAVPFLIEIAAAPAAEDRAAVLGLVGAIAAATDGPRAPHEAVVRRAAAIQGLLRDTEPLVRAAAAYVLGQLGELAPTLAPLLRAAIDDEPDGLARAGMLLGLGALREASPDNLRWLERHFAASSDERERFAAATALAYAARAATPDAAIDALAHACMEPGANESRFEGLPWDVAGETMPRDALAATGAAAHRALPIVLDALRATEDGVTASFLLEDALAIAFGPDPRAHAPAPLDEPQLRVLRAVGAARAVWAHLRLCGAGLHYHGLPATRAELLALLEA